MTDSTIQIARYPNRRFYARQEGKYVSLGEIEELVRAGRQVEIRDSQTDEDLTRAVLARIIIERQPDKMELFPVALLHFILQANDVMSQFLRDYFRHSLTYLEYLQRHGAAASAWAQPMHWVKAWLDSMGPTRPPPPAPRAPEAGDMTQRIEQLEERIRQLEAAQPPAPRETD